MPSKIRYYLMQTVVIIRSFKTSASTSWRSSKRVNGYSQNIFAERIMRDRSGGGPETEHSQ